jgi:hypothetical protein
VNSPLHLNNRSSFLCALFTTSHPPWFYRASQIHLQPLRKKVKVEITDEEGTTYSLALHGRFSHEKVMRMMDLIDLLGQGDHNSSPLSPNESTTYGRILKLIQSSYPAKQFSSADIARDYEETHGSPIPLSTVSTYLARQTDRGILTREKFGNSWVYHMVRVPSNQLAR